MDVAALIQTTVSLLTKYLLRADAGMSLGDAERYAGESLVRLVQRAVEPPGGSSPLTPFRQDPYDEERRRAVRTALGAACENPVFATRLATATEAYSRAVGDTVGVSVHTVSGNTVGRDLIGRDQVTDNSRRNTRIGIGGVVVALILLGLLCGGGYAVYKAESQPAITAQTSCRDYLQASTEERDEAVKRIGLAEGATGAGSPFARLNVDYECGGSPDTPVGEVIGAQNY